MSIIIWVDYEEFKPSTYKGVYATEGSNTACRSYTGDFETDFNYVMEWAKITKKPIMNSSSVDDWFADSDIF